VLETASGQPLDDDAVARLASDDAGLAALELDVMARRDPAQTLELCDRFLAQSLAVGSAARVRQARGMALRDLGDPVAAEADLLLAVEHATAASGGDLGGDNLWSQCALSLGSTVVQLGRLDDALELVEQAVCRSTGDLKALARSQMAAALVYAGRHDEAFVAFDEALTDIRSAGRKDWEAHLLTNRAVAHMNEGAHEAAIADSVLAAALFVEVGNPIGAAMVRHNTAIAQFRLGRVAEALHEFAAADAAMEELGRPVAEFPRDKSEALLAAGFFSEALEMCIQTAALFEASGGEDHRRQALVVAAEAALALGDAKAAEQLAAQAQAAQGEGWAARAQLAGLRARLLAGTATRADAEVAISLRHALEEQGQGSRALQAAVLSARIHVHLDQLESGAETINEAAGLVERAPFDQQIEASIVQAHVHGRRGKAASALLAVEHGLALTAQVQSSTGSFEVRVHAGRHADSLLALGVSALRAQGELDQLVDLVERVRSSALRFPAPQDVDAEVRQALEALRRAEASNIEPSQLAALQRRVSELSRRRRSDADQLTGRMGAVHADETALTWVVDQGEVICIIRRADSVQVQSCGDADTVLALIEQQAFCGRQLAKRSQLNPRTAPKFVSRFRGVSETLATLILPPDLSPRVLLNPPPPWNRIAWAALPGLESVAHVLTPAVNLARRTVDSSSPRAVVMGGSELIHVSQEVEAVASVHGSVGVVDPEPATLAELAEATIAHLAGHFVSRGSNQLFSEVRLGPTAMSGHDVLAADRIPQTMVLSACSSGRSDVVGAAALGFSSALLSRNAASVVVSQSLVEDGPAVVAAMTALHRMLADGVGPAEALRVLRTEATENERALLATWQVLGRGW